MVPGAPYARFDDRRAAGRTIAEQLRSYAGRNDVIVLGLPRGGVPVADEVALALHAPLDVMLVRKLGVPGQEELAFGAIANGGVRILNLEVVEAAQLSPERISDITAEQHLELGRRERLYRGSEAPLELSGRTAIIVDDGLATGATMRAAVEAVRQRGARPVVAAPVGAGPTCQALADSADAVVCTITPEPFIAVGVWYRDFTPTTDEEVIELLALARRR